MNDFYVYQLRLETSEEPFYIGKGRNNRLNIHFTNSSLKAKSYKNNIINKAVSKEIKIISEILHDKLLEEESLCMEQQYIEFYGRVDNGTGILANHTDGGEGIIGISEKTRKLLSDATKGKNNPNYGNRYSKEFCEYLSELQKGKNSYNYGKKFSETHKTNMSNAQIGEKNSMYGKTHTQETKRLQSISHLLVSNNTPPWNYPSCTEEQKQLVWANADKLYLLFLEGYDTKTKLSKITNIDRDKLQRIVNRFEKNWIPLKDSQWLLLKNELIGA